MILSEDNIKELLKWFVNSSETNKMWMPTRKECESVNHKWIQPESIEKMSDEDLKNHYKTYFKSGTGKKQKLIQIPLKKIISNENLRKSLLYLLNEKIDIKIRIDELLDTKNEKHIDGMGKAFITAFLMDFKPDKYCLWNGKTQMGLDSLGYKNLYHKKGDSAGDIYIKVLDLLQKLKNLDPELKLTYLDVDLFLHTISAEDEGINIIDGLKGNIRKWVFSVNMQMNPDFKEKREIIWNSTKELKKQDIVLFYCGKPLSHIADIFIANTEPYENKDENWKGLAVDFLKKIELKNPIEWEELKENPILKKWAAVRMSFGKSHFKISDKEWKELKRIILEKNPYLENEIESLENRYNLENNLVPDHPNKPKYSSFYEYLVNMGYYFDKEIIENYLLSLKVKPFVILTGNSGTGKTKIAQLFAQYLSKDNKEEHNITTFIKANNSSRKYKVWTLNRTDLDPLNIIFDHDLDIKVEGINANAKLSMSPRLWYKDPDKEIDKLLENIANSDTNKDIEIEIILPENDSSKYRIVPVGANWTENRHILGFYNVITGEYEKTCSLDLILKAEQDLEVPYFLILDEMNLSHVERYFSDFLSGMESKEAIPLHNNDIKYVPTRLELPENLLVIGTVNVDETTYMFSPKVLDRANTLEFLTPSASDYMGSQINVEKLDGRIKYLENPLSNIDIRKEQIIDLKEKMKDIDTENGKFWDLISMELENFQEILKKAGFDFGFRVINEIMRFMYVAWVYEGQEANWNNWKRYFDAQIKQKMLPKIHGSQRTLENLLSELSDLCNEYPSSKLKLDQMEEILKKQRYVSYTN